MADIADWADAQNALALDAALKAARAQAANDERAAQTQSTGYCLFCGAELAPPRRWCDADCRDLWERQKKRGVAVV